MGCIMSRRKQSQETIQVPVKTLDGLLSELNVDREVSVIKIDVEGWEQAVLAGAKGVLAQRVKPTFSLSRSTSTPPDSDSALKQSSEY